MCQQTFLLGSISWLGEKVTFQSADVRGISPNPQAFVPYSPSQEKLLEACTAMSMACVVEFTTVL